ncbi:MAG: hypothetical protein ACI807_003277 [Paracoccaceae bacterium]|jgi:hypothetical protein
MPLSLSGHLPGDRIAGPAPDCMLPVGAAPLSGPRPAPRARFDLHGLIHGSYWDLPGTTPVAAGRPPEIIALPGPVPPAPADAPRIEDARILSPGMMMLEAPDMRLLVEHGARVTLDAPSIGEDLTRLVIGYAAGTLLLHQLGRMPFHAAAAVGPAGAVLLLGDGGAGKSTLAAMLARRGMALVGDDMIALAVGAAEGAPGGKVGLHRSMRTAKLWRDSAVAADAGAQTSRMAGLEKTVLAWDAPGPDIAFPAPLRAIVQLGWLHPRDAAPQITRIAPLQALPRMRAAVARAALVAPLGLAALYLSRAASILACVPFFTLDRPRNFAMADQALDLVAACVETPERF